ncbi:MAG: hypothetical protein WC139_11815 [Candidatus Kapaibacterium sp.]
MLEQITDKRYKEAASIAEDLSDYSAETIITSRLPDFTKSFIINDSSIPKSKNELLKIIDKSVKLNLNYCIRPKWTMLSYIYVNQDSKSRQEILTKAEIFTFYSFYTEPVKDLCNDDSYVSIPRAIVEDLIDEINTSIHEKLTTETTGLKIKNFFLQLYKFKYGDNTEISLDMSVPFSFIRLFLEDKGFTDIVKMFKDAGITDDNDELELKTVIKIITGKVRETRLSPEGKNSPPKNIHNEIKTDDTIIYKENNEAITEEKAESNHTKKNNFEEAATTGVIEEHGIADEFEEKEKDNEDHIKFRFKEDELKSIAKKVFKGSRYTMQDALLEIEKLRNWRDATEYLKGIFITNKVNIGDKTVILFVDVLNDYFEKR